ncbi:MAG TPA: M14 family metallopeptidase [Pyrinomonadaceae bacterium]|jgi:murein tripeptide amidase MpaA|nr:M14 family metallopeptidase [Pyrinomonadaceae bacterium]
MFLSIVRPIGLLLLLTVLSLENLNAQSQSTSVPAQWQTYAEKTDYRETPTYDETIAYARRLAAASPWIRLTEFGKSGEGRALPLVIASKGATTPQAAKKAGKAVVLIQACIHAGETDGKDAGLALLRDIAITKTREELLNRVVILFIPIYNTDGHERRSPYNRINQNGPAEMGWRGNATNLNLNRDYLKADAPETRAWLKMWNEWGPDLFIDCHVTDGADFRYTVTYQYEQHENVQPSLRAWSKEAFDNRIIPAAEAFSGENLFSTYLEWRDNRYPSKGVNSFIASPRFATGYTPVARNRPGLLIETHMLKEHRLRVRGTYDILRAALEEVNRDPEKLLSAVRLADEQTIADGRSYDPSKRVALSVELTDEPVSMLLKGLEYRTELSDVSGAVRVIWGTKPLDLKVPYYSNARPTASVAPPLFYIIPPQWREVIGVLAAHGVRMQRLAAPATLEVESYRFRDAKLNASSRGGFSSFEGRVLVSFKSEPVRERRTYPAGSVVVPMAQAPARVALQLLEPDAPDSFVAWGFFHPVFEQKEYGEDYVLEKLAREMLEKDENLRREFERRIADDPKFASSATARLEFFYERSPYWDRQMNLYPVGRVTAPLKASLTDF